MTTISITDKNGTKTATINDGADGGAGSVSWNDLTDRPFGEKMYYEWTESAEYTETVPAPEAAPFAQMEKISNESPEPEFFIGKTCFVEYEGDTDVISTSFQIPADKVSNPENGYYFVECIRPSQYVSVSILVSTSDSANFMGLTLSKGIWVMGGVNKSLFGIAPLAITISGISPIDEKFIPDTVARTADVQTMIDTALGVIENGTY